jgi:hypothetical protein
MLRADAVTLAQSPLAPTRAHACSTWNMRAAGSTLPAVSVDSLKCAAAAECPVSRHCACVGREGTRRVPSSCTFEAARTGGCSARGALIVRFAAAQPAMNRAGGSLGILRSRPNRARARVQGSPRSFLRVGSQSFRNRNSRCKLITDRVICESCGAVGHPGPARAKSFVFVRRTTAMGTSDQSKKRTEVSFVGPAASCVRAPALSRWGRASARRGRMPPRCRADLHQSRDFASPRVPRGTLPSIGGVQTDARSQRQLEAELACAGTRPPGRTPTRSHRGNRRSPGSESHRIESWPSFPTRPGAQS